MGEEEEVIEVLDSLDEEKVEDIAEEIERLEEKEGLTDRKEESIQGIEEYERRVESNTDKIQRFIDRLEEKGVVELKDFKEDYREYLELKEQGAYGKALRTIPDLVRKGEMIAEVSEIISDAQEELKGLPDDIDISEVEKKLDSIRERVRDGDYREGLKEAKSIPAILSSLEGRKGKERRFKQRLQETRKKIKEARQTSIDIGPVKSDLKDAVESGEDEEYEAGLKDLDGALEKLSLISEISQGLKEAKFEITILDNKNIDIRPYMEKLKKAKEEAAEGDYKTSLAMIKDCLEDMEESSVLESFLEIEKKFTGEIPAADLTNLVAPVYSFLVPIFLVIYVCIEFSAVLLVFPLISPSRVLLYLTPMPVLQGESLPSLTASFFVALGLLVSTLVSYDFSESTLSIKRKTVSLSLAISLSMGVSLGMYVYFVPYSLARVHHYVVFFLTLILIATQLDLVLNHKKFVRKIEGGKREGKGLDSIDSTTTSSIFSLSLSTLSFSLSSSEKSSTIGGELLCMLRCPKKTPSIATFFIIFLLLLSGTTTGFNRLEHDQMGNSPGSESTDTSNVTFPKNQNINEEDVRVKDPRHSGEIKKAEPLQDSGSNRNKPIHLSHMISGNSTVTERYGWNISRGDLNNDLYQDIIIGAPYNGSKNGDLVEAGAVYIFFGYENISRGDLNPSNANVTIYGKTNGGNFGWDVAGEGDINNDGFDDLVIGEPNNGPGHTYVFHGRNTWSSIYYSIDGNLTIEGDSDEDQFGLSVASGMDIDNDGFEDIAIGAPNNTTDGQVEAGAAYILNGSNALPTTLDASSSLIRKLSSGHSRTERFGFSVVSAGDLNGDDFGDIAVGAPSVDEVYVYYGNESGLVLEETDTAVSDFEEGTTYRTTVKSNSTTPPADNGDIKLAKKTPNEGVGRVDQTGNIYNEERSSGSVDETNRKDGNYWDVKETGGQINTTADGEESINGTVENDLEYTNKSDDKYEELTEEKVPSETRENAFYDDFEDGDFSDPNWNTSGSPDVESPGGQSGTYSAGASSADPEGDRTAILQINIDTSNYTSIIFEYERMTARVGRWTLGIVTLTAEWSGDGGNTWNVVESISGDNGWATSSYALGSAAEDNSDFMIRFTIIVEREYLWLFSGDGEGWVDDIIVSGYTPTSSLEHIWGFSVPKGMDKQFNAEGFHTANPEHDNFTFYYSTTGSGYVGTSGWTEMFTITNTSDDHHNWTYSDSTIESYDGTIYIGVIDTDRGSWNTTLDTLYIDRMWFNLNSSAYYDLEFKFSNLGLSYRHNTTLSFYGYEEVNDCNISVWDNSTNQWINITDIDIGRGATNKRWYNSTTNLTNYIFDENGGKLAIRLSKSIDSSPDSWIHIDYLGLRFDPYINNGTFYSSITKTTIPIDTASVSWEASNITADPSNFRIYASADGGDHWEMAEKSGERIVFSNQGNRLMYRCEFELQNFRYSAVLHSLKINHPYSSKVLYGHNQTDFGWSLSGGENINSDDHDELLVGATVRGESRVLLRESFEGGAIPSNWTIADTGSGTNDWEIVDTTYRNGAEANNGTYMAGIQYDYDNYAEEWLITKRIDITNKQNLQITFYDYYEWPGYGRTNYVKVSTTDQNPSSFTDTVATYNSTYIGNRQENNWVKHTIDLSSYEGESSIYLAWEYTGVNGENWYIDNVSFDAPYEYPEGRAFLFHGTDQGIIQERNGTANVTITGGQPGDNFSYSLDMGDLNADGHADIYVGAPYNDTAYGTVSNAGGLYVFQGESSMSSSMTAVNATADYYGSFSDIYTGWSVCHLGTIGRIDPIAVGKPGWSNWYGNVTVLSRQRLAIINYRGMFQDNQNVTQDYAEVYNVSENTLDLKINVTAEMGWTSSFEGMTIRGWVDNGSIGNASDYPEFDYPNTRWNLSYNGTGWALLSSHPNDEIMLNSTNLTYSKEKTRNWTVSLYLGNQTRYTPKNGSGSNYSGLDTANTWDVSWNVSVSRGKGATVYNELGISKFCSVWTNDTYLYNNSGIPDTYAYPKVNGGDRDPVVHYSANYDFNLSVYPMNPLDNDESGEKIGLGNVSINTSYLSVWRSMSNGELGNNSASEINLFGGVQAAPTNRTEETITVSWRVYIPAGTPGWSYSSEQITYHIEIVDSQ